MNGEYEVSTDKKEKIKLESAILLAQWISSVARGGAEAELEVRTRFVAEGSRIEIKGISSEGKSPDTIKGKIYNNNFIGKMLIPEKVKPGAEIWFEAKLPKHGLKVESDTAIPAAPPILALQLGWDRKEIRRGDEVKLSAEFDNIENDLEVTVLIYEYNSDNHHDKIASFTLPLMGKELKSTWKFNYIEKTILIPTDKELKKYNRSYESPQYFFVVLIDGVKVGVNQESGLLKFIDATTLSLSNPDGTARANETYKISLADGTEKTGNLDSNGKATLEIPPGPFKVEYGV